MFATGKEPLLVCDCERAERTASCWGSPHLPEVLSLVLHPIQDTLWPVVLCLLSSLSPVTRLGLSLSLGAAVIFEAHWLGLWQMWPLIGDSSGGFRLASQGWWYTQPAWYSTRYVNRDHLDGVMCAGLLDYKQLSRISYTLIFSVLSNCCVLIPVRRSYSTLKDR